MELHLLLDKPVNGLTLLPVESEVPSHVPKGVANNGEAQTLNNIDPASTVDDQVETQTTNQMNVQMAYDDEITAIKDLKISLSVLSILLPQC